jgi:transcriptional regulator with XRE-family HTH domain
MAVLRDMGSVLAFRPGKLMEPKPKTFGEWLHNKRKAAGLSLQLVADRASVSKGYLSNLERNAPHSVTGALPRPSLETVDAIAGAIGAPIAEARLFAGYAAPQHEPDPRNSQLLFYFSELPEDQQIAALAMVQSLWRQQHDRQKADREQKKKRSG